MSLQKVGEAIAAQAAFGDEHPEFIAIAMRVVNRWGKGDVLLPHAIGEALQDAYIRGRDGRMPRDAQPGAKIIKRSAPVVAPATTILRRRK